MTQQLKFRQFIDGEFWYWGYDVNPDPNEFVPPKDPSKPSQQYAGLPDKNDVKIYEGDIVKTELGGISEVMLIDGCFSGATRSRPAGYIASTLLRSMGSVEIIGNIHENPELAKDI